jgi:hypothetical protein
MKTIGEIADIVELQTWAADEPATVSGLVERLESALDENDMPQTGEIAQQVMDEFLTRRANGFSNISFSRLVQKTNPAFLYLWDGEIKSTYRRVYDNKSYSC